jgi:hypothetical protein
VKLGHLGFEFAIDFGLVLLGVGEEPIDGNLAVFIDAEFLQGFV